MFRKYVNQLLTLEICAFFIFKFLMELLKESISSYNQKQVREAH